MGTHVEIESFITPAFLEHAYRRSKQAMENHDQGFAQCGLRAAKARDPKLLKALEKGAELLDKMTENQYGRTMRSPDATHGETKGTTEANLWREAYRMVDEGTPIENFSWIYGSAALLCGYQS